MIQINKQLAATRRSISRLIDAYEAGLLDKSEFEPRIRHSRNRLDRLEQQASTASDQAVRQAELRLVLSHMEDFAKQVKQGLHNADMNTRREIIRSLVKVIKIEEGHVRIIYRVSPRPFVEGRSGGQIPQHWPHRVQCGLGRFAVGAGPETLCLHGCDHLLAAHRGLIAWPERHHPDELSAIQHAYNLKLDRGEPAFYAEYQNEPLPEDQPDEDLLAADQIAAKVNGYARGEVPIGCTHLIMFVDVQAKALFWLVAGWEDDFTGYVIDYGTEPDQKAGYFTLRDIRHTLSNAAPRAGLEGAVYAGLERLINATVGREWRRDDGATIRIDRCLIDANWGSSTDVVYQFCRQSSHSAILMPSHGRYVGASSIPFSEYKRKRGNRVGLNWRIPTVTGRRAIRHVVFDTNYWKSFVHARFAVPMGDPGCLSLFGRKQDQHRLLAEHLTSEYRVKTEGRGRTVDEWKLRVDGLDNHWLDGLVGCAVAASMQGIVLFGTDVRSIPRPRFRLSELRKSRR